MCPQSCLSVYLEKSKDYSGDALFVSLTFPRRPISADTINSLTTEWLHARGLTDFTAHSTRGSSATEMVAAGVNPRLVAVLGDWLSYDCFQRFYLRVQACKAISEVLLPAEYRYGPDGAGRDPVGAAAASAGSTVCFRAR